MKFARTDALQVAQILTDAAEAEIMPRFRRLVATEVREKSSTFDIVTDADEEAERVISAALLRSYPGALIVGEEAAAKAPGLIAQIATAEVAFIIDPIDGTKNFVSGLPLFGMMIAATINGEIALAAIHDPICRDTALALRGGGSWIERDDRTSAPLRVAAPVPVAKMDAIAGTNFLPEPMRSTVNRNLSRLAMSSWMRCAAHEYRMAAAGHCHLLFYNKLMPWDHAAGWLLHREAGGFSAHFDGSPYHPTDLTGGLLCAPDETSWFAARDALLKHEP
jgi:fructose-1,6-bisphosphatase/inositol monophosphatase family enzyme